MNSRDKLTIAVLGATGAVGHEFVRLFELRNWPISELRLLASSRSAGKKQSFQGEGLTVQEVTRESFDGVDVAFFSAGASRSREFAEAAVDAGAIVIDNSSAFRMDRDIPLVVPEINSSAITDEHKIIANPNCTAIVMLMAIAPLRSLGRIERVIMSSYQSASGAGAAAMQELVEQTKTVLEGGEVVPKEFPHQCAFNVFSHNTDIDESGYNEEERKVVEESQKILNDPNLKVNVTCVRVPVMRAHSESITVEFSAKAPTETQVRKVLSNATGVTVVDDRETNTFPMPCDASGINEILVGRIRQDVSNPNAICLFASGDQLLKGAALNAVQIGEHVLGMTS